jgi:hypothetical protein
MGVRIALLAQWSLGMSFRVWHYLGRIGVPVLLVMSMMAIMAPSGSVLWGIGAGAFVVLLALGLVGGVMGVFLGRGKLRMRCPFCGDKGTVGGAPGGLALDCPACGLVYETGFLKLRLARAATAMPEAGEGRGRDEMPQALRAELPLFPRGWVYFRRWGTLRWYLLMLVVPATGLAGAWWRGQIVGGCIVFGVAATVGAIVFVFLNSGISSSSSGTFARAREPTRFWVEVMLLAALYVVISLAGWVIT